MIPKVVSNHVTIRRVILRFWNPLNETPGAEGMEPEISANLICRQNLFNIQKQRGHTEYAAEFRMKIDRRAARSLLQRRARNCSAVVNFATRSDIVQVSTSPRVKLLGQRWY
jgi:hypothetical protein